MPHGIRKGHSAVLLQETDGIPARTAAEAVVKAPLRMHVEGRRPLLVERAAAHVGRTALPQGHMGTHQLHEIRGLEHAGDGGSRDHEGEG